MTLSTESIVNYLKQKLPSRLLSIYHFGSTSGVDCVSNASSDIDIAFLSDKAVDPILRFELGNGLSTSIRRDVDLVDLRCVDTVFQHEILKSGRRIYTADILKVDEFEMVAHSKYCFLNEERRELIEDVRKRGYIISKIAG